MVNTVPPLVVIRPYYLHVLHALARDSPTVRAFHYQALPFTTASLQASLYSHALGLDKWTEGDTCIGCCIDNVTIHAHS